MKRIYVHGMARAGDDFLTDFYDCSDDAVDSTIDSITDAYESHGGVIITVTVKDYDEVSSEAAIGRYLDGNGPRAL